MKKIYRQLTSVDIDEQRRLWNERGKGYYGEFSVFCKLYEQLAGNCKILMNLNIPTKTGKTTEIDLLLIHETGLYVFEVKHYKGTIYGKDTDSVWTQYFRTAKNHTFLNPIEQNNYYVNALQNIFPEVPIKSIIVFTSYECNLRVMNSNPDIKICQLNSVSRVLENLFAGMEKKFSMGQIDFIFCQLSLYSKMQENVLYNGEEKSFSAWVQPVISKLEEARSEAELEKNRWIEHSDTLKKQKNKWIIAFAVMAVICIIIAMIFVSGCIKYSFKGIVGLLRFLMLRSRILNFSFY